MSNPISFQELFDLQGMEAAYKQLLTAEREFSTQANKDLSILNKSVQTLKVDLEKLVREFESLNVATDKGSKKLKELIEQKDKAIKAYRDQIAAMEANKKVQDEVTLSINKLKEEQKKLNKELIENKNNTALSKIESEKLAKAKVDLKNKTLEEAIATKQASANMKIAAGSYDEANKRAQSLLRVIKSTEGGFHSTSPVIQKNIQEYRELSAQLLKFEQQLGINYRNVGNYKSGYNGLANSVSQITRELPAFTNSVQTGLMGISNNIPILVDQITNLKQANKDLAAEGKAPVSILKQLGGALFSWNTLISLSITALTVFGPKLWELGKAMFSSKESFDAAKESVRLYLEAFKNSEYTQAINDVNQLRTNIGLYHKGLVSGEQVVKQYNETLGKTTGEIKNINQAETFLINNANAYIKMMYLKAAATLAQEEAAKSYVKQQQLLADRDKFYAEKQAKINADEEEAIKRLEFLRNPENSKNTDKLITADRAFYAKEREKINNEQINKELNAEEEKKTAFLKITNDAFTEAAKIAAANEFNIFGDTEKQKDDLQGAYALLKEQASKFETEIQNLLAQRKTVPDTLIVRLAEVNDQIAKIDAQMNLLANPDLGKFKLDPPSLDPDAFEAETQSLKDEYFDFQDWLTKNDDEQSAIRTKKRNADIASATEFAKKNGLEATTVYNDFLKSGYETFAEYEEAKTKKSKEESATRAQLQQEVINLGTSLVNGYFELEQGNNEAALESARRRFEVDTQLAGDNEAAKKKAARSYDAEVKRINRKKAQDEKAQALFSIALSTSIAVAQSIAKTPETFGLPFSAFALAQGVIQAALVSSRQIPQYYKGVEYSPEGPAIVGEHGRELIKEPSGKMRLTGDKAEMTYLQQGSKVFTATATKDLLKRSEIQNMINNEKNFNTELNNKMIEYNMIQHTVNNTAGTSLEDMEKAFTSSVSKLPLQIFNLDEEGYKKSIKKGNSKHVIRNSR